MEEDKNQLVNLFNHYSAPKKPLSKDAQQIATPSIQMLNPSITTCHVYHAAVTYQAPSNSENSCTEIRRLEDEISRLESLLKNK